MKEVIAINYLCLYAMIEMVLKDIDEMNWDQIQLANQFGVVLPEGNSINGIDNVTYCIDERKCGAHINIESLNSFFSMENIPLRATILDSNPFNCYDEAETNDRNKYIVYLYSYGSLNNDPKKRNIGHASIKISDIRNGIVSIYDPGPVGAGIKEVRLSKLYDAIGESNGGILIIERIAING